MFDKKFYEWYTVACGATSLLSFGLLLCSDDLFTAFGMATCAITGYVCYRHGLNYVHGR